MTDRSDSAWRVLGDGKDLAEMAKSNPGLKISQTEIEVSDVTPLKEHVKRLTDQEGEPWRAFTKRDTDAGKAEDETP